jgi:benzil reductase ((S)-benzoin forming)
MKLALITGGSRGLGLALCEQLLAEEYQVVEFSRSAPHVFSIQTDLADPEKSRLVVLKTIQAFEPAQLERLVVINNAGMLNPIGPTSQQEAGAVLNNLNANFTSAILALTEVIRRFQAASCPKLVANITSGAALKPRFGWSLYCAAKAGMENFIRVAAIEQQAQPYPFKLVNIDPGVIDTEMQALIRATDASDFPDLQLFIQRKEQGLLASPQKVAGAVLKILALPDLASGGRYIAADYAG